MKLLENALDGDSLAAVVVDAIYGVEQKPMKVRFNTVDGCATNGVANMVMKALFRECNDIVCMSHSSNISMELFQKTTKTAHKFISLWSQCLTQGHRVRAATQLSLGEKGLKTHAIRWMAEYRAAVQIHKNFDKVVNIIKDEDVGCASLIGQLVTLLEEEKDTLRLELALISDSGSPIVIPPSNISILIAAELKSKRDKHAPTKRRQASPCHHFHWKLIIFIES